MKVSDFDFELPDEAIALRPASPRDAARLLCVENGGLTDRHVSDLPSLLKEGDVLVLNETRVLPAALTGRRPARPIGGGGPVKVTINLHKHIGKSEWRAFVKPAKRIRLGDRLEFTDTVFAEVREKYDGGDTLLEFNIAEASLLTFFEQFGSTPLPPYIGKKRAADENDKVDYQTVYANQTGSVAAPTAGLHFTPALMSALENKGVSFERLLLHVGAGTFLPIKSDDTTNHVMHSEWFEIDPETAERLNAAKSEGRRIIAVGTTALRALESAAIKGRLKSQSRETEIFIKPGYNFQFVDGLMTNFHLPKSTLFMLVCALAGTDNMKAAYKHAIAGGYRFYSYGDSSLLWGQI